LCSHPPPAKGPAQEATESYNDWRVRIFSESKRRQILPKSSVAAMVGISQSHFFGEEMIFQIVW